jgi:hypothetical protein
LLTQILNSSNKSMGEIWWVWDIRVSRELEADAETMVKFKIFKPVKKSNYDKKKNLKWKCSFKNEVW